MLKSVFLSVCNMSVTASVAIVAVLLARLALKRAPRIFSYGLWAVVLFRLLCPVSLTSQFSVMGLLDAPTAETGKIAYVSPAPSGSAGTEALAPATGTQPGQLPAKPESPPQAEGSAVTGRVLLQAAASGVWLCGAAAMLALAVCQLAGLRRRLTGAVPLGDGVYLADHIPTPFVLGVVRPKIYLPPAMPDDGQAYILQHERHHIRRGDHVIRLLAFAALCIHWFNPLVWLAFSLSGKDMELSCDEAVIRRAGGDIRADYSASLLRYASGRWGILGAPLTFGRGDIRERIENLMKYRRPTVLVVALALVACVVLTACLSLNPEPDSGDMDPAAMEDAESGGHLSGLEARMAAVTGEDIRYLWSTYDQIGPQPLASALNGAAGRRAEEPGAFRAYYDLTAYLSGGPDGFSGEDEQFHIQAGLKESLVFVRYLDGAGGVEEGYFQDDTLYRLIRDNYHTDEVIDEAAYGTYREILEARAQNRVDTTRNMEDEAAFTGFEIVSFTQADAFETPEARYDVYLWDVAFLTDDPDAVGWAGGMLLDAEARVRAVEQETYFVVQTDASGNEEFRFLFWDLYAGEDAAAGQAHGRAAIEQAFQES